MTYPHYDHDPIPMRRLPDVTDEVQESWPWEDLPPSDIAKSGRIKRNPNFPEEVGDFFWNLTGKHRSLVVKLPSPGNGRHDGVREWPITWALSNGAQWDWDGNEDAPTLIPSLGAPNLWHGWISNGQLKEA